MKSSSDHTLSIFEDSFMQRKLYHPKIIVYPSMVSQNEIKFWSLSLKFVILSSIALEKNDSKVLDNIVEWQSSNFCYLLFFTSANKFPLIITRRSKNAIIFFLLLDVFCVSMKNKRVCVYFFLKNLANLPFFLLIMVEVMFFLDRLKS